MKYLCSLLVALLALSFSTDAMAQKKDKNSYNVNRALECLHSDDYETAKEYLTKEIADNPKSAMAYDMLGYIFLRDEAYGNALTSYTTALKYYPKKDKDGIARTHYYLARTYLCLEDTVSAITSYKTALKYKPSDSDCQLELADVYYYTNQYSQAEEIYNSSFASS